jgi:hypothetical protein
MFLISSVLRPEIGARVLLDPINITQNTALASLNTLGSLIAVDWRGDAEKHA